MRLDKWLYFARFYKTRALATARVEAGGLRINGERVSKAARQVEAGDVLTFAQGQAVRVLRIVALPHRRGPAPEAQALYDLIEGAAAEEELR